MPVLHLGQPGFIYSACRPITKHCESILKFREIANLKHIYKNELGETCFSYDAAYSVSKHLAKRTISDKISKERAYETPTSPKYDGYQRRLEWKKKMNKKPNNYKSQ